MRKKIIITGPESTGKTVLCEYLAEHYRGSWVPEFAREYIEKLGRPYTKEDVENIGRRQIEQLSVPNEENSYIFFDTGLIITKVWMEVVFKQSPAWIDEALNSLKPNLVLLCYPDLPWESDSVRENGGEMRNHLFDLYEKNLIKYGYPYAVIKGSSQDRFNNAVNAIDNFIQ